MKTTNQKQRAFTLLELLIALFIIAIIISLSVIVYDVTWAKSHNSKRVSDVVRIQNALELYHKQEGHYPSTITFGEPLIGTSTGRSITYLETIPKNPSPRADGNCPDSEYQYSTSTDAYNNESFLIDFCVSTLTNDLPAGPKCATAQGIVDSTCAAVPMP